MKSNTLSKLASMAADPQYSNPRAVFWQAMAFATALPDDCREGCHVAPESCGDIQFDWDKGCGPDILKRDWVTLSIDSTGEVTWASRNRPADKTFKFAGKVPEELIAEIRKALAA